MSDEENVALVTEIEQLAATYVGDIGPDDALSSHHLWNAPFLAIGALLYGDALGTRLLPDHVVARLWEISWLLECDPEDVMPQYVLDEAREGRRTRPVQPVRYPLKGGGHGAGRGNPGKSEYPARWSDDDAMEHVMSVATGPDGAVKQPDGTFRAWGVRDGVDLRVLITELGSVVTSFPVAGDGVVINPLDDLRAPYVARLQHVIDATEMDDDAQAGIDELMAAGEWDQVVLHLRALPVADRLELEQLAAAAGLSPAD